MISGTCANQIDCYGYGDGSNCWLMLADNLTDEIFLKTFFNLGCKTMCLQNDTTVYKCSNSEGCVPVKWKGDGETDCPSNGDEGINARNCLTKYI